MKTAISYLIDWTENINWRCHLLNVILQDNRPSIELVTKDIVDLIACNKSIALLTPRLVELEQSNLYIREMKNPININALSSEARCSFGQGLNVFYGENGTGKSSYVKVFRKLADNYFAADKNLDVMSNVYTTTSSTLSEQNITVSFSCNGTETLDQCVNVSLKHGELSRINVFDSNSITPLLNADLSFSILPKGLSIFPLLTALIDEVKQKLDEIVTNHSVEQDKVFTDSSFDTIREDIRAITSTEPNIMKFESYIRDHYLYEDMDNKLEGLEAEIRQLQSANPIELVKILTAQVSKLELLRKNLSILSEKVSSKNIDSVNALIQRYDELCRQEKAYNNAFSMRVQHLVNVNSNWTSFIAAARDYYRSIGIQIPTEKSACLFCGQPLEKPQVEIIASCFHHIDSKYNQSKKDVEKDMKSYLLPEIAITLSTDDAHLFYEDKRAFIERLKATVDLVDKNRIIFKSSIESKQIVPSQCVINLDEVVAGIAREIDDINRRLADIGKTTEEVSSLVLQLKGDRDKLIRAIKVASSREAFRAWYSVKELIDALNDVKKKLSTTALTIKSKEAFQEIVGQDYLDTFKLYCKTLGVPNVGIAMSSQKGQSKRAKYVVKEGIKVTQVMSEGEQKALALAEFATDLKIRNNYCSTLFDDPVTSFDYKRARAIATMIYEMSNERQVIVFTHNIMFYYYLYNCCSEVKNKENKFFKIEEFDRDNKGLITQTAEGRLENLKEITGKIKSSAQKISSKSCLGDELDRTLKATYSDIRTWCELIVEEGFLKRIIRRYEPDIKFALVPKITQDFVQHLPLVSELFNKSCRYMLGHSQPTETQNIIPTREEFQNDLKFILDLYDRYKS